MTAEALAEAASLGLNIDWLVRWLPELTRKRLYADVAPIWAAFNAEVAPLLAAAWQSAAGDA